MMPLDWVLDQTLEVFTDADRAENWKFLWRVLDGQVSKDEYETRIEQIELSIEYARQNRGRSKGA